MKTDTLKPLYTAAPVTDREAPAPWAECESCGTAAALPASMLPGATAYLCPACLARDVLYNAASEHLAQLLAPHLGAWGNYWAAAGLSAQQLREVCEHLSGAWAHSEYQARYQAASLYRAMRAYPAPLNVTTAQPDRVEVNALTLPRVTAAYPSPYDRASTAPEPGKPDRRWAFSLAYPDGSTAEGRTPSPGADAVLIFPSGPQGDAILFYTGIHGSTADRERLGAERWAVPARFVPQVRAALGYWGEAQPAAAGGAQ